MGGPERDKGKHRRHTLAGLAVMVIVVAALLYAFDLLLNNFILRTYAAPLVSYQASIIAVAVLAVGYGLITILTRILLDIVSRRIGRARAVTIKYLFSLVAYLVLAFVVLDLLQVNLSGLIVGSAFTAIVLGLASQTVLANFFSGLVLVIARPVYAGERITFATWQFGVIAPAYPPKFFSNDFLISGFTGVVEFVGFLYVVFTLDDGRTVKIPAGIFIQAMITINSRTQRMKVRSKYEVEKSVDTAAAIEAVRNAVSKLPRIAPGTVPEVFVSETTLNTYILAIDIFTESQFEEPVRSEILQSTIGTIAALKSASAGKK